MPQAHGYLQAILRNIGMLRTIVLDEDLFKRPPSCPLPTLRKIQTGVPRWVIVGRRILALYHQALEGISERLSDDWKCRLTAFSRSFEAATCSGSISKPI